MTDTVYSDVNKTAEYFGVSIHTIRKWVKEGHIHVTITFGAVQHTAITFLPSKKC